MNSNKRRRVDVEDRLDPAARRLLARAVASAKISHETVITNEVEEGSISGRS